MKLDLGGFPVGVAKPVAAGLRPHARCEADRLTDVILCPPHHLTPVPCCAVTRENIGNGFGTCTADALAQHAALVGLLERHGVRCHILPPSPDLPDMCFTRDVGVATPFGLVALHPALPHRRREIDAFRDGCARWNLPVSDVGGGTIEGGDVCVAREGLLIVGTSGERSSAAGVEAFAVPFRAAGWKVLVCRFHPDHLHLDTIFCMLAPDEAIGCVELLDPGFVAAVEAEGIRILPAPARAAATLGCNVLALGDRRIIGSARDEAIAETLRARGYRVDTIDISQFAACGGGIHCLTLPVRRIPG